MPRYKYKAVESLPGEVIVFHLERDYVELLRMMARRERAEGADDEGGEIGQNKVCSVGLGDLIKT